MTESQFVVSKNLRSGEVTGDFSWEAAHFLLQVGQQPKQPDLFEEHGRRAESAGLGGGSDSLTFDTGTGGVERERGEGLRLRDSLEEEEGAKEGEAGRFFGFGL